MTDGLAGQVALVAGATRGAGRGIAVELGRAGATVYCTGRSTRGNPSGMGRLETIEETAEQVSSAGGFGIAVRVDHSVPAEVALLATRISGEQGRLDILVDDIWGGDPLAEWGQPFWEVSIENGLAMQRQAVETHLITVNALAGLMVKQGHGLIVEVTDGNTSDYRGNLFYDLVKSSIIRLAFGMAQELRPFGVTALSLTPGFLRSEAMLDYFGVTEGNWQDATDKDPYFAGSETPSFVGRAVVALASDQGVTVRSGMALSSWELSREFGFVDADGRRPDWGAFFTEMQARLPAKS